MRKLILILIILNSSILFSQKSAAVKAVIKTATKSTTKVFIKTSAKETTSIFTNRVIRTKLAKKATKFSDIDFINYYTSIGYSKGNAKKLIKDLGKKKAIKIFSLLDPSAPKAKRLLAIEDFKRSPDIIEDIFDNSLEKAYSKCLGMSEVFRLDKKFLKQVKSRVSPINLTPKQNLHNKLGLNKNIPFVEKVITLSNGLKIKGVFPKFPHVYQINLPVDQYLRNDAANYNFAFRHFQKNLRNNPELQKKFTNEQVKEMLSRNHKSMRSKRTGMIPGYTWHHSEDGMMQLVKDSDHMVKHIGLRALEGGGRYLRESTLN